MTHTEISMTKVEIRKKIEALADCEYQKFHSSLLPGVDRIAGVRLPLLRKLAKEIAKEDWRNFLLLYQNSPTPPQSLAPHYYEETMLEGLVICYAKMTFKERLAYIENFVPKIDNWAVCDSFCCTIKDTKKHPEEMWAFLQQYLPLRDHLSNETLQPDEFEIRFGVVMLLDYYITEVYIERVLAILASINHNGYYVKMAVAWAISICFVKFPDQTMALLIEHQAYSAPVTGLGAFLDDFTYNKSIQKICESFRVDKEVKKKLRQMKRP